MLWPKTNGFQLSKGGWTSMSTSYLDVKSRVSMFCSIHRERWYVTTKPWWHLESPEGRLAELSLSCRFLWAGFPNPFLSETWHATVSRWRSCYGMVSNAVSQGRGLSNERHVWKIWQRNYSYCVGDRASPITLLGLILVLLFRLSSSFRKGKVVRQVRSVWRKVWYTTRPLS